METKQEDLKLITHTQQIAAEGEKGGASGAGW